jgi:hypothetical protein
VIPPNVSALFGPVPPHAVADCESASSATPQVEEADVEEVAFTCPIEVNVVVADDEAVLESWPVGIGDPLVQDCPFEAVTEPPAPVPVE